MRSATVTRSTLGLFLSSCVAVGLFTPTRGLPGASEPRKPATFRAAAALDAAAKEAEAALELVLEEGGNRKLYKMDKAAYHLRRPTEEGGAETIASGHFHGREEMEERFERLMGVLGEFSANENCNI